MDRTIAGLAVDEFVGLLYQNFLRRDPDPAAQDKVERLRSGVSSAEDVIEEILSSEEFGSREDDARLMRDQTQYGELELLIQRWMKATVHDRWVVDVGARGKERSNSWDLMKTFGWRGLLTEANVALIPTIEEEFAGLEIELLNCAVSDYDGEAAFYLGVNEDVSSLDRDASVGWGPLAGEVRVAVRRLGPLLKERGVPEQFGLLSIDIEGEDIKVLNDLIATSSYRPKWVLIEASYDFQTKALRDLPFDPAVLSAYRLVDQTASNLLLESTLR